MKRTYLTPGEVSSLIAATKGTRNEARDRCLLTLMYRHGLRASEATDLMPEQINLTERVFHVARKKNGLNTTHPLQQDEIRLCAAWLKVREAKIAELAKIGWANSKKPKTPELVGPISEEQCVNTYNYTFFLTDRCKPISRKTLWHLISNLAKRAGITFPVYPHMLRHSCGFALAAQGADTRLIQDYLGHKSIANTVIYTKTVFSRFRAFVW